MWFLFEAGVIVGGLYAGKTKQSDDESVENVVNNKRKRGTHEGNRNHAL